MTHFYFFKAMVAASTVTKSQEWTRTDVNINGNTDYFTLKNDQSGFFLTAISDTSTIITGEVFFSIF